MSNQNPPPGDRGNQGDQGNQGNQGWGDQGDRTGQGSQNPYASPQQGQGGQPAAYGSSQGGSYQGGPYEQQSSGGPGMAIVALVLGILALIGGFFLIGGYLFGIPAIIVGAIASSKAKKGRATGRGIAIGGVVLGVIGLLISIAFTVAAVFLFQAADFGSLTECLDQAGSDTSAQAECQQQFQDELEGQLGG